jgi:hypothetical protein
MVESPRIAELCGGGLQALYQLLTYTLNQVNKCELRGRSKFWSQTIGRSTYCGHLLTGRIL